MTGHWRWMALGAFTAGLLASWWWQWLPVQPLEIIGMVSGLACTILAVDEHIANFPVGIVNSLALLAVFWKSALYGNMGLQVIYLALGIQGWVLWTRRANQPVLPITRVTRGEWIVVPLVGLAAAVVVTYLLWKCHDPAPLLDAVSAVLAMCGQYLLNRKRVENWLLGGLSVILVIVMSLSQHLWLTAGLYACYGALCIQGYRAWARQADAPHAAPAPAMPPVEV
jgi:nicotinamide mononucleotide transporter